MRVLISFVEEGGDIMCSWTHPIVEFRGALQGGSGINRTKVIEPWEYRTCVCACVHVCVWCVHVCVHVCM